MLLFRGTNSNESSDYHPKMNWNVFSDRYEKKVFPAIRVPGKSLCSFSIEQHAIKNLMMTIDGQLHPETKLVSVHQLIGGAPEHWILT